MSPGPKLCAFGPFRLDAARRRLLRDESVVALTPKAVETLLALVERRGQLVGKEELMRRVWPDVAVEENNLNQNISALRKALGEKRDEGRYILTVPGQGYRFVASVTELPEEEPGSEHSVASAPPPGRRIGIAAASALALVLALAGAHRWASGHTPPGDAGRERKSIAVLPFATLGAAADQDHLGLGLADALITKLSNLRQIDVRPTTSISRYDGPPKDLGQVCRELDVDWLLVGSLQKSAGRIRVTVQLVRAGEETPFWGGEFDEKDTDIFAVEDAAASDVARAILPPLSSTQQAKLARHYTDDGEAHQAYMWGRYYGNKKTAEGLRKSIEYFEEAILRDPGYALAYAALADSYSSLRIYDERPMEIMAKARSAALKAIELDDGLAEAHASLGYVKHRFDWDFTGAEREFRRALDLDPACAMGYQWYGWYLLSLGRFDAAIDQFKRAHELDPVSLYVDVSLGVPLLYARRYGEAEAQFRRVIQMEPERRDGHRWLAKTYQAERRYDLAIPEFERVIALSGGEVDTAPALGCVYAAMGRPDDARALIQKLQEISKRRFVSAYYVALIYASLGDKDQAFEWLSKACDDRDPDMPMLGIEPQAEGLRSDSRYARLLERVGLPLPVTR